MKLSEVIASLADDLKRLGDVEVYTRVNGKKVKLESIGILPGNVLETYTIDPDHEPPEPVKEPA